MAIPITIPRLGWTMDEGVFAGWLKKEGESVRAGEYLFSLESEKATEDIECLDAGTLRIDPSAPRQGETVKVGTVIGYLVQPGEAAPFGESKTPSPAEIRPAKSEVAVAVVATPKAPRSAPAASPRARRVARELGADWQGLKGSGKTGRIREQDIRAAASTSTPETGSEVVPLTPIRRAIAERMAASVRTTAPVTLTTAVDAGNLVNLRNQFKAAGESEVPGYTEFLVKLTAVALKKHPDLNARWQADHILRLRDIHIGIAVDTEAGLLVPVIRNVAALSLREVAARSRDLVARARSRRLRAEEMQGGTCTITNLGSFGIDAFSPIINPPECAVLGVGRIQQLPVVKGEQIVLGDRLTLSLTFDHRLVDGAPAARFLQELGRLVENPGPWLVS